MYIIWQNKLYCSLSLYFKKFHTWHQNENNTSEVHHQYVVTLQGFKSVFIRITFENERLWVPFFFAKKDCEKFSLNNAQTLTASFKYFLWFYMVWRTGYSLSEALILASIIPKYVDRSFIELQVQCKKTTSVHQFCFNFLYWTLNSMSNLLSYFAIKEWGLLTKNNLYY